MFNEDLFYGILGLLFLINISLYLIFKIKSKYKEKIQQKARKQFESFIQEIKQESLTDYIKLHLKYEENLSLFTSKIGGLPYIPKNKEAILDSEGDPMYLLAQINCEELPKNNIYPPKGILQFFIQADDMYGLDEDANLGLGHKVIYYETYDKTLTLEDVKNKYNLTKEKYDGLYDDLPHDRNRPRKITFSLEKQSINCADYKFENYFLKKYNQKFNTQIESIFDLSDEYSDYIYEKFCDYGSQIAGYPFFTQQDIREYDYKDYEILLLQIDEFEDYIHWGSAGIANFFITKKDLENKDFSRVLYNWDCG